MTLRGRFTLFFAGIVVVPLFAATLVLQALVGQEIQRRSNTRLETSSMAVAAIWAERVDVAEREVRRAAERVVGGLDQPSLDETVEQSRLDSGLDFLVVTNETGSVIAASLGPGEFRPGVAPPTEAEVASEEGAPTALRARAQLTGRRLGEVSGGWYVDSDFLQGLAVGTGTGVLLVADGSVLSSTVTPVPPRPDESAEPVSIGGGLRAIATAIQGHAGELVIVVPDEGGFFQAPFWGVAGLGLLLATVLGFFLAGVIVRPVHRLTAAARAVSQGNLETRIEVAEGGDVGRLADAFNVMTRNLRAYIGELEESRDELRRGLERLGSTLQSTLDLDGMLGVVLETASATLGARAGVVFLLQPSSRELRLRVARGYEPSPLSTLRVGQGIAGRAAAGRPVLVPSRLEQAPQRAPAEPSADTAVAVPLRRGDRTIGVLALYGRSVPEPFREEDVATLTSLAGQASVAIENVLLHEEAQRLSITDGLTGVWNRRYLEVMLAKEIERAQRFGRPLSLLMIDIDGFKEINDAHGHLAGDGVLVEMAQRVKNSIRGHIDFLARYGGEEFVAVLPETPLDGGRTVADKIREVVAARPMGDGNEGIPVTVSIGVSAFPRDGTTSERLLDSADLAMYRAKERGRNRVEVSREDGSTASTGSSQGNRL